MEGLKKLMQSMLQRIRDLDEIYSPNEWAKCLSQSRFLSLMSPLSPSMQLGAPQNFNKCYASLCVLIVVILE